MKKIVTFILLLCMVLSLAACTTPASTSPKTTTPVSTAPVSSAPVSTSPENTPPVSSAPETTIPEITLQEIYEAGKSVVALLGEHESVYLTITVNDKLIREEYLSKEYSYSFHDGEHFEIGSDSTSLFSEHAEYVYSNGLYLRWVTLTPSGMLDLKESFASAGTTGFVSSQMMNDTTSPIVEKDGLITVSCTANEETLALMGEDVVSCVETYTLDAKTREMISITTVYTYENGTVDEGVITITRDGEIPEGMKTLLAYDQETEDLRTITIVSNPGTENEKTESIQAPKGLYIGYVADFDCEQDFTVYTDAACTQPLEDDSDTTSDVTVYIKWNEASA